MAWAKVDDQWFASRKVVPLTLAARGLWTTVLSWSCAQQSPQVPGHMVAFLAGGADVTVEVAELEHAGLWHREGHGCDRCPDPDPGGWVIHDWAEYQDKSQSEKRAEAGAKGGKKSGEVRRQGSKNKQPDEANAKQTKQTGEANDEAGAHPGPSRPGPSPTPSAEQATDEAAESGADDAADEPAPDAAAETFEQFWRIYPARHGKKPGKANALIEWRKLTLDQRRRAYIGARNLAASEQLPKDAERFLRRAKGGRGDFPFDDWQDPAVPRDGPTPLPDRDTTDWTAGWKGRIAQ